MPNQLDTIDLPSDLFWVDEFDWSPVVQNRQYAVDGSLIIQEATAQEGRSITLAGDHVWIPRSDVIALTALADVADTTYVLQYETVVYNVRFKRSDNTSPIKATPVYDSDCKTGDHPYMVEINLIEV